MFELEVTAGLTLDELTFEFDITCNVFLGELTLFNSETTSSLTSGRIGAIVCNFFELVIAFFLGEPLTGC